MILGIEQVKQSSQLTALKKTKQNLGNQVTAEARDISRKLDSNGIENVIYDINNNRDSQVQLQLNSKTQGIIDTTALALDLRTKQLKQIMVLNHLSKLKT